MSNRISEFFMRTEMACNCGCGFDTVDVETLALLDAVRVHFDSPVIVNSGCRCAAYNKSIGGARNSQHKLGRAADIRVVGVEPADVYDWIAANYPHASLGHYQTFTHVDTRTDGPARWGRHE